MILPIPPLFLLFQLPRLFLMVINKEARTEAMVALSAGLPADSLAKEEIEAAVE